MKAYEILENYGWCQHAPAVDEDGYEVLAEDQRAVKFSMLGAIIKAYDEEEIPKVFNKVSKYLLQHYGTPSIPLWSNDPKRTKDEVLEVLKKLDV